MCTHLNTSPSLFLHSFLLAFICSRSMFLSYVLETLLVMRDWKPKSMRSPGPGWIDWGSPSKRLSVDQGRLLLAGDSGRVLGKGKCYWEEPGRRKEPQVENPCIPCSWVNKEQSALLLADNYEIKSSWDWGWKRPVSSALGREQMLLRREKSNRQSPRPSVMEEGWDLLKREKNEKLEAKPRVKT